MDFAISHDLSEEHIIVNCKITSFCFWISMNKQNHWNLRQQASQSPLDQGTALAVGGLFCLKVGKDVNMEMHWRWRNKEHQRASKSNFHVKSTIFDTFHRIFMNFQSFAFRAFCWSCHTSLPSVSLCSGRPRLSSSFGASPGGRTSGRLFFNMPVIHLQHDLGVPFIPAIPLLFDVQVNRLDASSRTEGGWNMLHAFVRVKASWTLAGLNPSPCSCLFWAV